MDKKVENPDLTEGKPELIHGFSEKNPSIFTMKYLIILFVIAVLGIGSGFFFAQNGGSGGTTDGLKQALNSATAQKGKIEGSDDLKTFKDTVEGVVKDGGIEGEGAFHLVRPGGDSQNVYMTSSSVDLSKYIGVKVKVWGQTQKALHAGWLMDVGRIQVL